MRFRCKIDGKSFASCRSPRTYKHLKPGQHQFRVYAPQPERRPRQGDDLQVEDRQALLS